jgi:ribosomal protein L37E
MTQKPNKKTRVMSQGYRLIYKPEHPDSMKNKNWLGYIYEHRIVAEKFMGRRLRENEVVHHLDGNCSNNRTENLIVLEQGQHTKLHKWLERTGVALSKDNDENGVNSGKPKDISSCIRCGKTLQRKQKKFCSESCHDFGKRKVEWPDKDSLIADLKHLPMTHIGKKYGVSDNAVRKWIKFYEIDMAILSQASSTLEEGAETSGEVKPS